MHTAETSTKKLRLRACLRFEEVNWALGLSILVSRFELPFDQASQILFGFRNEIMKPLNLHWFMRSRLSQSGRSVMHALCQAHGVDQLTIEVRRELKFGIITINCVQVVTFTPFLDNQDDALGQEISGVSQSLGFLGFILRINSIAKLLAVQLMLALLAAVTFSAFAGLLLYGISVSLVFVINPAKVTIAATRNASLGIALLCSLIGIAGIFGRAISNLLRCGYRHLRSIVPSQSHYK